MYNYTSINTISNTFGLCNLTRESHTNTQGTTLDAEEGTFRTYLMEATFNRSLLKMSRPETKTVQVIDTKERYVGQIVSFY